MCLKYCIAIVLFINFNFIHQVNTFNLNLNVHVVRNSAGDFCQEKLELGQFQHVLLGAGRHFLHVNKLTQQNEECVQSQSRKTLKSVCLNCNFYI